MPSRDVEGRGRTVSAVPDDVQEFAASLTRIKERTDRSYGQLARRLNMNTSTLHRYCAGDTVPLDFAPVERFAALCGATGEERLELHRLWLLAVAARQRARTGGAASSTPEPAQPTETAPPEENAGSVPSEEQAESVPPEKHAKSAPPEAHPESAAPTEPPSPRRPWHRRRRTLVSAAVAAVLLATLGGLAALPSGRSPADSTGQGGTPTPSRTTSAAQRPSAAPTSPSPSPDTEAPKSPSGTPTPTPSDKPEGTPTKDEDTGERKPPATGIPLTWTANSQIWNLGCGHDYVIGKPPKEVPPPPAPQDAGAWVATQRGVHGRNTIVEITVQGKKSTAVVLTALRVRVVGRGAPAEGNAYAMDQGCGGRVSPRYFDVDLDKDRPIARPVDGADLDVRIPAVRLPYRVSADDPEVLMVSAETETCDCSWYLELEWSSEGRTGTIRIDDDGRPFRTTGIKGLPRYEYDTLNRRWVSVTE